MKNFRIEPAPASALVQIAWEGGGELPDDLKGSFMTPADAKRAIEVWKAKNPDRDPEVIVQREQEEKELRDSKRK